MDIISQPEVLRSNVNNLRSMNQNIGFVPTMGYLHDGHRALIARARKECDVVIVSIFVNPSQFGPNEDLDRYPRDFEADTKLCKEENVDIIFHPQAKEMYSGASDVVVSCPQLSQKLCGHFRPGHFDGVTTIMSKLLTLVGACSCYMGKKDAQQLLIMKKLVAEMFFDVSVIGCSTVRENDGLALSSRNAYLSADQRKQGLSISLNLENIARALQSGEVNIEQCLAQAIDSMNNSGLEVQYCEFVECNNLEPVRELFPGHYVLCLAAVCGNTRLIDNFFVEVSPEGDVIIDRGQVSSDTLSALPDSSTEATHV